MARGVPRVAPPVAPAPRPLGTLSQRSEVSLNEVWDEPEDSHGFLVARCIQTRLSYVTGPPQLHRALSECGNPLGDREAQERAAARARAEWGSLMNRQGGYHGGLPVLAAGLSLLSAVGIAFVIEGWVPPLVTIVVATGLGAVLGLLGAHALLRLAGDRRTPA